MNAPIIATNGYLGNPDTPRITHNWLAIDGNLAGMSRQDTKRILAENLRALMKANPSLNTQMKVGDRAGISQSTVGRILRAEVFTQLDQVEALAEIFNVEVAALLTDKLAGTSLATPEIAAALSALTDEDRRQVFDFIDFLATRHGNEDKGDSALLEVDATTTPEHGLKERLLQAIQRELNNDTLNIGHEREQETTTTKKRRHRKSG